MSLYSPRRSLATALLAMLALLASGSLLHSQERPSGTPESIDHLNRGIDLARRGQHEEAAREFRLRLKSLPDDADAHFHLARSLMALAADGKASVSEAVAEFTEALRLDPTRDFIRLQLAEIHGQRRLGWDPAETVRLYEEMLRRLPGMFAINLKIAQWVFKAEVRCVQRQLEAVLKSAPAGSPAAIEARTLMAEVHFRMGRWEAARSILEELIAEFQGKERTLGVNLAPAWNSLGHCFFREKKYPEAARAFRKAFDMAPSLSYQWDLRLAFEGMGGYPEDLPSRYQFPLRPEVYDRTAPPLLKFTDIAPRLGIDKSAGPGACGWADYDLDGRLDVIACGGDKFCTLFKSEGEGFRDVTAEAKLSGLEPAWGTAWGDYDNDGDPDLYAARNGWNGPAPNSLHRNNGDGTFTDVSAKAEVDHGGSSFHAAWFDYDRDGWLDLVVSNGVYLDGSTNRLYRNMRDGTFTDVTESAGLGEEQQQEHGTIGVALGDYDDDGWPDIFFHGRFTPNRLYRNDHDGTFTDVAVKAGVGGSGVENGYVALFNDFDSDGDLDIWTGSLAKWDQVLAGYRADYTGGPTENIPRLYRNNGDGTFKDVSMEAGFRYPVGIMAVGAADLDNDGFIDIYMGTGNPELRRTEPHLFYHNRGGKTFEDVTRFAGLGTLGKGHGTTFLDWDADGDLDVYVDLGGFYHGDWWENAFFLNLEGNRNHWLQVRLYQEERNRDAIGARVTVHAGSLRQVQEVTAGKGFGSTDPPTLHFGLGGEIRVKKVEIRWPDGWRQTLENVDPDQKLVIRRPAGE
jgi:tetratricopeptide (TPR) repeat protein